MFPKAETKQEGGKLWPVTYHMLNGVPPPKSFYTAAELKQQEEEGYTDDYYEDRQSD